MAKKCAKIISWIYVCTYIPSSVPTRCDGPGLQTLVALSAMVIISFTTNSHKLKQKEKIETGVIREKNTKSNNSNSNKNNKNNKC